jgi:hypothetical protein
LAAGSKAVNGGCGLGTVNGPREADQYPRGSHYFVPNHWWKEVSEPDRYLRQFDHLHQKYAGTHRIHSFTHDGVSFSDLVPNRRRLSRMIARAVKGGTYAMSPARVKRLLLDKPRDVYYFEALDFVVHGVVADVLCDAMAPLLAPSVYSYRLGVSSWQAVRQFAKYAGAHRRAHPDAKTRGLYVFRGDVNGYIEAIPVGERSPVWPMLQRALGEGFPSSGHALVQSTLRPEIVDDDGSSYVRSVGIPFGSPVATQVLNLYLCDLDHQLQAVTGSFYVRFGDDLLFAHQDPEVVRQAIALIGEHLREKKLELQASKQQILFFNGAGRKSAAWSAARGSQAVVFLGCEVRFDGTITLPTDKTRVLLADLKARVRRTAKMLRDVPLGERGAAVCAVANQVLDHRSPFANRHAMRLCGLVDSRRQLADLDHLVAGLIAETLSGRRGVRAFRDVPPRMLREKWKLASLVAMRNRVG